METRQRQATILTTNRYSPHCVLDTPPFVPMTSRHMLHLSLPEVVVAASLCVGISAVPTYEQIKLARANGKSTAQDILKQARMQSERVAAAPRLPGVVHMRQATLGL